MKRCITHYERIPDRHFDNLNAKKALMVGTCRLEPIRSSVQDESTLIVKMTT